MIFLSPYCPFRLLCLSSLVATNTANKVVSIILISYLYQERNTRDSLTAMYIESGELFSYLSSLKHAVCSLTSSASPGFLTPLLLQPLTLTEHTLRVLLTLTSHSRRIVTSQSYHNTSYLPSARTKRRQLPVRTAVERG